jgi:hypothetical protein
VEFPLMVQSLTVSDPLFKIPESMPSVMVNPEIAALEPEATSNTPLCPPALTVTEPTVGPTIVNVPFGSLSISAPLIKLIVWPVSVEAKLIV